MSTSDATTAAAPAAPSKTVLDPVARVGNLVTSLRAKVDEQDKTIKDLKKQLREAQASNSRIRRIPKPSDPAA